MLMRPWPKGSPLRNTVGTAMIWRALTSSWNSAPSIITLADAGVEHGHQVQRLHHVRAVVAGQRDDRSRSAFAGQGLDLLDHRRIDLGRVAAGLQQGQHQRGELVAHRDAGEADARASPGRPTRRRACGHRLAVLAQG
jgi:hypothetical protein